MHIDVCSMYVGFLNKIVGTCMPHQFVLYAKPTYISVDYHICIYKREDTLKYSDEVTGIPT